MGKSSLSFTACILALLCPFVSPTPLDKGPAGQAPQVEPRDVVTVTRHVVNSIVQSNPPFYNRACKAGGCTFAYEVRSPIILPPNSTPQHDLTGSEKVGISFLLAHRGTKHSLLFHAP